MVLFQNKERNILLFYIFLIILVIIWVILSMNLGDPKLMFQRSGSVMVLFSTMIGYSMIKEKIISKILREINILLLVSGTLIWGYGDIIYTKSFFDAFFPFLVSTLVITFILSKYILLKISKTS
ncbi:MAG: hypothetical protein DRG78_01750 [Epsilonproteobacteria bacterium]|nr:MAG: hypothetical protein DRG78_01750 [Campylobacterota bacterium]